jgi:FSR family fosmidomycin resistance protein-like MFS transporter
VALAAGLALALGWRWAFLALALLGLVLVGLTLLRPFPSRQPAHAAGLSREAPGVKRRELRRMSANLRAAFRHPGLIRWILLLQFSDLLLDVFFSYVPLYLTDVVAVTPVQAGLLLSIMTLAGLAADMALIPLLERVPGRAVVRASAVIAILVFVALLLAPWPAIKIALIVLLPFSTLGWYQVLQGEAYAALPGRSGTVMAVNAVAGLLNGALAWSVGWVASQAGLPAAMWLLLLGPVSLALFVPHAQRIIPEMTAGSTE